MNNRRTLTDADLLVAVRPSLVLSPIRSHLIALAGDVLQKEVGNQPRALPTSKHTGRQAWLTSCLLLDVSAACSTYLPLARRVYRLLDAQHCAQPFGCREAQVRRVLDRLPLAGLLNEEGVTERIENGEKEVKREKGRGVKRNSAPTLAAFCLLDASAACGCLFACGRRVNGNEED